MKANELMIGDYVRFKGDCEHKHFTVGGIKKDGYLWLVYLEEDDEWYEIKLLEPVPLTDEIFNDNGFGVCVGAGGLYQFVYSALGTGVDFNIIRYVHEVQHALKLCGVNKKIVIRKEQIE